VLTVAEMRAVDEAAQATVPLATLVERAGAVVGIAALQMLGNAYGKRVTVVAGPGNNGNDGRVAARRLIQRGARVTLLDARAVTGRLAACDLVIDAAYGTGFRDEYVAPDPSGAAVLAVDVPTGLDAGTGIAGPDSVIAQRTVTFGALKPGLLLEDGPERAGSVSVHPIGLPVGTIEGRIFLVEDSDVTGLVPARRRDDHKWRSAVFVVAGSPGMYGAASFVARSAARAGAGMVRLGIPGADPARLPAGEAVARALSGADFDAEALEEVARCRALVVGPGNGRAEPTRAALRRLIGKAPVPVVVDADGLVALGSAEEAAPVIAGRPVGAPVVLTPHAGEFAGLGGRDPRVDRIEAVRDLARRTGAIVLLKGSTTVVADPSGRVLLSTTGSARLATAGTGDVLSGVIGAFIARGVPPFEAAALGAHVHGRAAERGRPEGLVAGDLPDLVSDVLSAAAGRAGG
jgi:NAD(P)H-hydrate epimerase